METTNHPEPAWILKRSSHDTASKKEEPVQEAVILPKIGVKPLN